MASRQGRRPGSGACERPRCTSCERPLDPWGRCRRRDCPGYFRLWAGDCARYVRENVIALVGDDGRADMTTITAPGAQLLRWDEGHCAHRGRHRHSGADGCRVRADDLAVWHRDASQRLSRFLRAVRERVRREGHVMPEYVIAPEPQQRGALHWHLLTATVDREVAWRMHVAMVKLGPRYGFGQLAWDPSRSEAQSGEERVGRYLAKLGGYVTKEAAGQAGGLREVLAAAPRRRVYRASTRLTRRSRATMRNLRLVRWAHWQGCEATPAEAEKLWAIYRAAFPPSRPAELTAAGERALPPPAAG